MISFKSRFFLLPVMLICMFMANTMAGEQPLFAEEEKTAVAKSKKTKKSSAEKDSAEQSDYNLEFMLKYNQVSNYQNDFINSPALEGGLNADVKFRHNRNLSSYLGYSFNGMWYANNVEQSDYTLNSMDHNFDADINYRAGKYTLTAFFDFDWVLKPDWPDLYQPEPAVYNPDFDTRDIKYKATDRFSYRKYEPGVKLKYRISNDFYSRFLFGFIKKDGYTDPNYNPKKPTHLTPDKYNAIYGEAGLKFSDGSEPVNFQIKNRLTYLKDEEELARDSVTGKTHYSTNPNPLYREINNSTDLELTFNINSINMEITPAYSFEYNLDMYQGYYTYTGHTFGIEMRQQPLKEIMYKLKAERKLIKYTSDGYGDSANHLPLTDGNILYKKYTEVDVLVEYLYSREIVMFADYFMKIKGTNYPDYVPGVFPGNTKNYETEFSYDNYRFGLGVRYIL